MTRKVAIILDVDPLEYCGGAERWALTLAQLLNKHNVHVTVFAPGKHDGKLLLYKTIRIVKLRSLYKVFGLSTVAHMPPDPAVAFTLKDVVEGYAFDSILLNNLAVVFVDKVGKYAKTVGVVHDYYPVCPLRDLICSDESMRSIADKKSKMLNCISCIIRYKPSLVFDTFLFSRKIREKLLQLDTLVFVSNAQKTLTTIYSAKSDMYRDTEIIISGPLLDPLVEQLARALPRRKESLAIAYIGGLKKSRGFDRFADLVLNVLKYVDAFEVHIHGKIEEKSMIAHLRDMYKTSFTSFKSKKVKLHIGYIDYSELLDEMVHKSYVIFSTSRCPESAPLYVIESFALGSLTIAQRRLYGPYEIALKILGMVNAEIQDKYIQLTNMFTKYLHGKRELSSYLAVAFKRFVEDYFTPKIFSVASRAALRMSYHNFKVVRDAILN